MLQNLFGLRDAHALAKREYAETAIQQFDIERGATNIARTYDARHLRSIHEHLFGSVYAWAGQFRSVGMSKGAFDFAEPASISGYLAQAHRRITTSPWAAMHKTEFATECARIFAYINYAHPFREGNGRTSNIFMQQVSELSRFRLEFDPRISRITPEIWNQASHLSVPDIGSHEPESHALVPVFARLARPRNPLEPARPGSSPA
ncbi:cell filamentation protein [Mycetocola sp. BIGb0189]|uniref:Fic/DOC family protein n=1 Tax=Mycetocola sp. BIGb0189 TaxID=2940604 RepID=UPI00216958DD|nr:Fic family protein [Mycetocola sp. BIGb0189]MCS4276745.1 cell filamentation protein [Mycetocola sp. BIGb0189]